MKNLYAQQKNRHQKEMNAFPLGACFNNEQFDQMMRNWGLTPDDTDKICSVGGGCYVRKSDSAAFREMLNRFEKEREEAIAADKTGDGFIYHMFLYELANHEYCRLRFAPHQDRVPLGRHLQTKMELFLLVLHLMLQVIAVPHGH